jgi:hypothetical protein
MNFGRSSEKNRTTPDEAQRRRATDDVLGQTLEIADMPEVQDALERLGMGRLPHLLDKMYVPNVENGTIKADKGSNFIPLVSIYPHETLSLDNAPVSLAAGRQEADGMTLAQPRPLVALAQSNASSPTAPLVAIHEGTHVHQNRYHTVNNAPYERHRNLGSPKEVEALNVEAVVADVLIASRKSRWYKNPRILTPLTAQIRSKQPVIPYPRPKDY